MRPCRLRDLRLASEAAHQHGVELFLVGGAVRDMLMERSTIDIDLSAVGGTAEFASALACAMGGEVVALSQFGTFKLTVGDATIDLATARRESYAHPGALPAVVPGSIQEDLARRDFSINAMAVSLRRGSWGELLDPFGGRGDVQRGVIRVLHPRSFQDDATRILRAIRYCERLRFRLEASTEQLMERDLPYLGRIKGDRIRHELQRTFREDRAAHMLALAQKKAVLSTIHPALGLHPASKAALHRVRVEPTEESDLLFLAILAYPLPKRDLDGLVARLNMDTRWARVVRDTAAVRSTFDALRAPDLRRSQIYHALCGFDPAAIKGCALSTDDPQIRGRLELYSDELSHVRPALKGRDIVALGVPTGPMVGSLLGNLLESRLDGLLTTRQEEMEFVASRLKGCSLRAS